ATSASSSTIRMLVGLLALVPATTSNSLLGTGRSQLPLGEPIECAAGERETLAGVPNGTRAFYEIRWPAVRKALTIWFNCPVLKPVWRRSATPNEAPRHRRRSRNRGLFGEGPQRKRLHRRSFG